MKTSHWLSAFAPGFVSKESPSHRFCQPSAWQSQPLCLRSPAAGEVRRRRLPSHLTRAVLKSGEKHLQVLGRALANLAGKAAPALPGIIGSIVSWLLNTLKIATWLAENLWALAIAVGTLLFLVAARNWLARRYPKHRKATRYPNSHNGRFFFSRAVALCRFSADVPSCPSELVLFCKDLVNGPGW